MEVNINVNWESGCVCDDKVSVGVFVNVHFSWTCQKLVQLFTDDFNKLSGQEIIHFRSGK